MYFAISNQTTCPQKDFDSRPPDMLQDHGFRDALHLLPAQFPKLRRRVKDPVWPRAPDSACRSSASSSVLQARTTPYAIIIYYVGNNDRCCTLPSCRFIIACKCHQMMKAVRQVRRSSNYPTKTYDKFFFASGSLPLPGLGDALTVSSRSM